MQPRQLVIGLALAATVAASIWAGSLPEAEVVPAVPSHVAGGAAPGRATAAATPGGAAAAPALDLGQRPPPVARPRDLFAAYSWTPPPPPRPAVVAPPPEPPQAPAPTFTYIGRLLAGGRESFLFIDAGRTQIVAVGGRIGDFQLESTSANALTFIHLPTGLPVTLPAPAAGEH